MEKLQDCLWQHAQINGSSSRNPIVVTCDDIGEDLEKDVAIPESAIDNRYYRSGKNQGAQSKPRTWRTRADPFEKTWDEIRLQLELNPESTAKQLIERLIEKYPGEYSTGQTWTLQRRIAQWRLEQTSQEEKMRLLMTQAK